VLPKKSHFDKTYKLTKGTLRELIISCGGHVLSNNLSSSHNVQDQKIISLHCNSKFNYKSLELALHTEDDLNEDAFGNENKVSLNFHWIMDSIISS
jgi:hypothetical protein